MHLEAIFNFLENKRLKYMLIAGPPNFERVRGPGASAPFAPYLIHHLAYIGKDESQGNL